MPRSWLYCQSSYGAGLIAGLFVLCIARPTLLLGAEILGISPHELKLTRGDKVTLRVATTGESPKVEWWSEGRVICKSDSCTIDTSDFSPGQTIIDVAIEDALGIIFSQLAIKAEDAPPLYNPKNLIPDVVSPPTRPSFTQKGQWLIIERGSGVTFTHPSRPKDVTQASMFTAPQSDVIYYVAAGGYAIVRRVGLAEQVLVSPSSRFTIKDGRFELLSGRVLWRTEPDGKDSSSQLAVAGGLVDAIGPSLIGIESGYLTKTESRALVQNFQSSRLRLSCGAKSQPLAIGKGRAALLVLNTESSCIRVDTEDFQTDDSSGWVAPWSPWWFREEMYGPVDRWRSDYPMFSDKRPLAERMKDAEKFKGQFDCASALDFSNIHEVTDKRDPERLKLVGFCQFQLGMYGKSLATFSVLNEMRIDPAWTAAMMAKTYQKLHRHDLALYWFGEARSRGYSPATEISRLAVVSAEALKDGLETLKWLEISWLAEEDLGRKEMDLQAYEQWHTQRPGGGEVSGSVYMDSQAVPLNTKTSTNLPLVVKASRAMVSSLEATWWSERDIAKGAAMRLHGYHHFKTPIDSKLSFAASSINTIGLDFKLGKFDAPTKEAVDRWNFIIGPRIGIGLAGGESQRDRYGWTVSAIRPSWTGFSLTLESDKYFDPKPKGTDLFDLDMERYTGEVDHSHIDLKFLVGFESRSKPMAWSFRLGSGSVDYRTLDMDAYDHSLALCDGRIDWHLSARAAVTLIGKLLNRSFKQGSSDVTQGFSATAVMRVFPLWRFMATTGFEQRRVHNDPLTTWNRLIYGISAETDL